MYARISVKIKQKAISVAGLARIGKTARMCVLRSVISLRRLRSKSNLIEVKMYEYRFW